MMAGDGVFVLYANTNDDVCTSCKQVMCGIDAVPP